MVWLSRYRIHAGFFVLGLIVFGAVSGSRLWHQSSDPHFVYQADAWLHGQLAIDPPPTKGDDWAKLEEVVLDDGAVVRGRRFSSRPVFRQTGGHEIPLSRITGSNGFTHFVSFPPVPALVMLPAAALGGRRGNDVFPTVLIAALILPLMFSTLRRLSAEGFSKRSVVDDVWLTVAFAFGSVLFFAAVQGRVWFTAHVVGVALLLGYAQASIGARRPLIAGLCLGLAAITRTPMAFMFPLFLFEAWRIGGGRENLPAVMRKLAWFAAPVVVLAIAAMVYNYARFGEPTEFGHSYLAVRQQAQIEAHGLFSYQYLARNLAVAFTLLPEITAKAPHLAISGHGLAIWVTTPLLFWLLWPRQRPSLHRALWLTVAAVAVPTFFYQNSGWVQFGYRFSLDYLALLFLLIAIGDRPLGKVGRGLIILAVAINLFGAITFARDWRYYRLGGDAYPVVVRH